MSQVTTAEFLSKVEALSPFNEHELEALAQIAETRHFEFGAQILKAGDIGEGLYVVGKGRVRLLAEERGKEHSVGVRKTGGTFAEGSVLEAQPIEYSVRASGKAEILVFPRAPFKTILDANPAARDFIVRYLALMVAGGFVTRLFNLKGESDRSQVESIVQSIGVKRVHEGDQIVQQDDSDDQRLYVIKEGQVSLVRKEEGIEFTLAVLGPGEVFGEKACLLYKPQQTSAVAKSNVVLIVIPQKSLHAVIEQTPGLIKVLEDRIQFRETELNRQIKLAEQRKSRFQFDLGAKPKFGERILKRFAYIEQAEQMDCGAACMAMVCKHYDIPMTVGKLREMVNVTADGATMESLARVGESLGFATRGVRCTYDALLGFELPFIAHWEGYHFIIVYGIAKSQIWVADPAVGLKKMTAHAFERGWTGNCLLFSPTDEMAQMHVERSPWLRFLGYLVPFKKIVRDLLLAALIIQVLGLAQPIIIQNILDRVMVHNNYHLLNVMVVGLAIALVFSRLTGYLSAYLSNFMIRKMDFNMISHFYKHVLALPLDFFVKRKTGDIMARFQENDTIRRFMTETSISTVLNTIMVFTYLGVMFMYNVTLTLLLVAFLPPIIVLTVLATPKYKDYARRVFSASASTDSTLVETLSGIETVKGMGSERALRLRWEKGYAEVLDLRYRFGMFAALVGSASELLQAGATLTLLWVGSKMVLNQQLTIGQLMAFNTLIGSVMTPLIQLVAVWDEFNQTLVSMERLGDVLDIDPEQRPRDMPSMIVLPDLKGQIRFENVFFRYGGKETPYVLENIDVEIDAGSTVAIVGQSGSGKTTLAKLLVGFYQPVEGNVLVDGHDMKTLDMRHFRSQVGYVMQSNLLFSGTISENIAIGDPNPDRQRLVEVAKLADAHGFISNLPLGYEQRVGEQGKGLSGGQIQRICIARALYHDPKLLIFDEATSALDSDSEHQIQDSMKQILNGRTAVFIAHRLSTVMNADRILVLYDGAITEAGNHQELLAKKGMYFHLVQKQIANSPITP
ncbi:MAG: peptidase domain-containing ABC transporter [Deltaproteobacteria bacterium]